MSQDHKTTASWPSHIRAAPASPLHACFSACPGAHPQAPGPLRGIRSTCNSKSISAALSQRQALPQPQPQLRHFPAPPEPAGLKPRFTCNCLPLQTAESTGSKPHGAPQDSPLPTLSGWLLPRSPMRLPHKRCRITDMHGFTMFLPACQVHRDPGCHRLETQHRTAAPVTRHRLELAQREQTSRLSLLQYHRLLREAWQLQY